MKNLFLALLMTSVICSILACSGNNSRFLSKGRQMNPEVANRKILIAYFSWGGNTQQVAENIAKRTGGTLFRIETVHPYPTEYIPCTEVAKKERDNGIRPELKATVEDMEQYDTIFVGCPVWWHTAPMAVISFLESKNYNFAGKTIIPFCTYGATYRDETLAKIVEFTPDSKHLKGFGTPDKNADVKPWLEEINIINNK
jgi:flavodoxin